MIKGIPVTLYEVVQKGVDAFNHPIYDEVPTVIQNVLVAPMNDEEILDTLNLTGKRARYRLGLPKGDTHDWENRRVSFFGEDWRVIGKPTEGIEANIPLQWNKKVQVESYVAD